MSNTTMPFELLSPWLAVGKPDSSKWQPINRQPLWILVGLTGVGKTSTVQALSEAGLSFALLPNRRTLTDKLMISWVQAYQGQPARLVTDRAERFAYTATYRKHFAGGMAHTLAQLLVKPTALTATWLFFDGLRGENELSHAIELLPQARFILLDAPNFVRIHRLLGRHDKFDQISSLSTAANQGQRLNSLAQLGIEEVGDLLTREQEEALLKLVRSGEVSKADLQAKLRIVLAERQNYDPIATRLTLQTLAPERTIFVDTTQYRPNEIAELVINFRF